MSGVVLPEDCRRFAVAVYGTPGSARWRAEVAAKAASVAATSCASLPLCGPLAMTITFTVRRPRGLARSRRVGGLLLTAVHRPERPALAGLLDATEAGLSDARVWADAAQVVRVSLDRGYPGESSHTLPEPGAQIMIWQVPNARWPGLPGELAHAIADGGNAAPRQPGPRREPDPVLF